jgi:hypothetical protein
MVKIQVDTNVCHLSGGSLEGKDWKSFCRSRGASRFGLSVVYSLLIRIRPMKVKSPF